MAKKEFKFVDLDKKNLPVKVGNKVNGLRFYEIDGKA